MEKKWKLWDRSYHSQLLKSASTFLHKRVKKNRSLEPALLLGNKQERYLLLLSELIGGAWIICKLGSGMNQNFSIEFLQFYIKNCYWAHSDLPNLVPEFSDIRRYIKRTHQYIRSYSKQPCMFSTKQKNRLAGYIHWYGSLVSAPL